MSGEGLIKSFRFRGNYCRDFFFFFRERGEDANLSKSMISLFFGSIIGKRYIFFFYFR